MQWIITTDKTESGAASVVGDGQYRHPISSAVPINSMRRAVPNPKTRLAIIKTEILTEAAFPFEFRLLDDDSEVYFVGRCGDLDEADGDQAFAPLDWAGPRFGTTTMEYRKVGETVWQIL